jgi:hypothetical protein
MKMNVTARIATGLDMFSLIVVSLLIGGEIRGYRDAGPLASKKS